MNKNVDKIISEIASYVPAQKYNSTKKSIVSGELVKGAKIKEDAREWEDFMQREPAEYEVNHKRRLRKAYKKRGKEGVFMYLSTFIKDDLKLDVWNKINSLPI